MAKPDVILTAAASVVAALLLSGCSGQSADTGQAVAAAETPVAGSVQTSPGSSNAVPSAPDNGDGARKLARDYKQRCARGAKASEECQALHALLVAEVSTALDLMATSKDQRTVPQALAALEFPDQPSLLIPAFRILGEFPTTPGIVDKAMPHLLRNRSIDVQRAAAGLLSGIVDVGAVEAGRLWLTNHEKLITVGPYDDYPDFPAQFSAMGFPPYPGAEWFSPGDTDRAVGFSTEDDAATVTRWFAQKLSAEPMDMNQWLQRAGEQVLLMNQNADPSGAMEKMQALMQRAFKGDETAAAELETIQKDLEKAGDAATHAIDNAVSAVMPPDSAAAQARWIVARSRNKRFSTVVLVYPLPSLQRTVIQTIWDLSDYPSAWPSPPETTQ